MVVMNLMVELIELDKMLYCVLHFFMTATVYI